MALSKYVEVEMSYNLPVFRPLRAIYDTLRHAITCAHELTETNLFYNASHSQKLGTNTETQRKKLFIVYPV